MADYMLPDGTIVEQIPEYDAAIFGQRLRLLMHRNGLTTYTLAHLFGIQENTFIRYISGVRNPSTPILMRLSAFFKVSINWMLGMEEYGSELEKKYNNATKEDRAVIDFILQKYEDQNANG